MNFQKLIFMGYFWHVFESTASVCFREKKKKNPLQFPLGGGTEQNPELLSAQRHFDNSSSKISFPKACHVNTALLSEAEEVNPPAECHYRLLCVVGALFPESCAWLKELGAITDPWITAWEPLWRHLRTQKQPLAALTYILLQGGSRQ